MMPRRRGSAMELDEPAVAAVSSSSSEGIEEEVVPSVSAVSDNSSSEDEDCPFDEAVEMPLNLHLETLSPPPTSSNSSKGPSVPEVVPRLRPFSDVAATSTNKPEPEASNTSFDGVQNETSLPLLPDFIDLVACPCCHQCLDDRSNSSTSVSSSTLTIEPATTKNVLAVQRDVSLISAAESVEEGNDDGGDRHHYLHHDMTNSTGVSTEGIAYQIQRVLVEGLLHKKGTGLDWRGSRSWKARWARLALGRVEGYGTMDVPLLCISWFPSSTSISTVIVLDSTVVMALDVPETEKRFRFEIRHASSRENASLPVTRTFTAPSRKARDAWVFAMSEALLTYEKEKAKRRKRFPRMRSFRPLDNKSNNERPLSPTTTGYYKNFDFIHPEARLGRRSTASPPLLPRSRMSSPPLSPKARPTSPVVAVVGKQGLADAGDAPKPEAAAPPVPSSVQL